jgi:hypothetical protein
MEKGSDTVILKEDRHPLVQVLPLVFLDVDIVNEDLPLGRVKEPCQQFNQC